MKRLRVSVTEEDIQNGESGSVEACAVALAVRRAMGVPRVWIMDGVYVPPFDSTTRRYRLTRRCERFIVEFDMGDPVKPQVFLLPEVSV